MDHLQISLRSKSSSNVKAKPNLIKELQKIAKQAITPSNRRNLLKNIPGPQTTRASGAGKSYENLLQKPKQQAFTENSSHKRTSPKIVNKSPQKLQHSKSAKKSSESSLKNLSELTINQPSTPRPALKIFRNSPKSNSKPKKNQTIKTKKNEIFGQVLEKVITSISYRSCTGSISGKEKINNQDSYYIIQNYAQCKNQTLLGVMDGHGIFGHEVSSFVKKQLPLLIENNLPYEGKD
jgi:hypothetical protein